jgi:hypothetical protein
MLIAVTRLRIRSPYSLPAFFWYAMRTSRQAQKAQGYIDGKLLNDANRTFWTMTAWNSEREMRMYQNDGVHRKIMPKTSAWTDEAAFVHWSTDSQELPGWDEAYRRLVADGRATRLTHPSAAQTSKQYPPPAGDPYGGVRRPKKS